MVRDARPTQPGAPEANSRIDAGDGVVEVGRRCVAFRPRESAVRAVAPLQRPPCMHAVVLDTEREVRLEADLLPRSPRVGRVTIVADERPRRECAAVVERRLADEL